MTRRPRLLDDRPDHYPVFNIFDCHAPDAIRRMSVEFMWCPRRTDDDHLRQIWHATTPGMPVNGDSNGDGSSGFSGEADSFGAADRVLAHLIHFIGGAA